MKKIWIASAAAAAIMMTGCGGSSSPEGSTGDELPTGLTLIMFDNASGAQYSYDTEHEELKNLNEDENAAYNMTGKNGKLAVWTHHMEDAEGNETEEQKVVMFNDVNYNILNDDDNVTYDDIHYLGHFHGEEFAAHSADEFNPAMETNQTLLTKKLDTLKSLSGFLLEREEVRKELDEALEKVNAEGYLCNFIVLGEHEVHEEAGHEEHGTPHIALTSEGYVYAFEEHEENGEHVLEQAGTEFLLKGMTECTENESNIFQIEEEGVVIFSSDTQTLHMVDRHSGTEGASAYGTGFHEHSTVKISEFMPAGFEPTSVVAIGEGEHDHEH